MKILVGMTELEVTSCSVNRYGNGKLELKVTLPADGVNEPELRALFKNNTEDILKYADDGVTVIETLSGFRFTVNSSYDESTNSITIYAEGVSEAEFQNGRLRQKIEEQNKKISTQDSYIVELQIQNEESIVMEAELLYELSLMQLGLL